MKKTALFIAALTLAFQVSAGNYKNFKVSSYIRARDVMRMRDRKFLEDTWERVSSQVALDKI